MYEKILNLDLFKGLCVDQVSTFLEKTPTNFIQYPPLAPIAKLGEQVNKLICILSGQVKIIHTIDKKGRISFAETINAPFIINADRLFGMYTYSPVDVIAISKTGTMEINKDKYLTLLSTEKIYLLNFLNYLSLRAQNNNRKLSLIPSRKLHSGLKYIIEKSISKYSQDLTIHTSAKDLAIFFDINEHEVIKQLNQMVENNEITFDSTHIKILNRSRFLDT